VANNEAHNLLVNSALQELALQGYTAWKNDTGVWFEENGRPHKYGKKGSADIFCILPIVVAGRKFGIHAEFEAKTGTGRQSKSQALHQEFVVERNGGIYILFRSVPDLLSQISKSVSNLHL
jgi:hypothetical protein